jgi:hypothetical protein
VKPRRKTPPAQGSLFEVMLTPSSAPPTVTSVLVAMHAIRHLVEDPTPPEPVCGGAVVEMEDGAGECETCGAGGPPGDTCMRPLHPPALAPVVPLHLPGEPFTCARCGTASTRVVLVSGPLARPELCGGCYGRAR